MTWRQMQTFFFENLKNFRNRFFKFIDERTVRATVIFMGLRIKLRSICQNEYANSNPMNFVVLRYQPFIFFVQYSKAHRYRQTK